VDASVERNLARSSTLQTLGAVEPGSDRGFSITVSTISNFLAISGSLRAHSTNTEVLRACAILAPASVRIRVFDGLGELPHFNPDMDKEGARLPPSVESFRAEIDTADALLISSPEYAHGVPGALKNALDWLVSAPGMLFKPIGLINISSRSTHAYASLLETLRTMSTVPVPDASVELSLPSRSQSAAEIAADPQVADRLRSSLAALLPAAIDYRSRSADWRPTPAPAKSPARS
jgi:chromate reductase, NAD(P)H dehydrogenase (quinone)